MNQQDICLIIVAIAIVALDILVRVYYAPNRRDAFYKSLLEMQAGLSARARTSVSSGTSPVNADDSLSHALLAYFQQSFTSRQVMAALATSVDGMAGRQLEQQIAEHVAEQWNRELSINAIRRVIMILMGANLVDLREGKFALTNVGWNLLLKTKNAEGPRWSEARRKRFIMRINGRAWLRCRSREKSTLLSQPRLCKGSPEQAIHRNELQH